MRADTGGRGALPPLAVILLGLGALEAAVRLSLVSPLTAASPSQILSSLPLLVEEGLGARFAQTFAETALATLAAMILGAPIGWTLASSRRFDRAFRSWVAVLASAPLILLYPLFLVAFGRNMATVIAIGAASAVAPIALNTRDGLVGVKPVLLDVGRSYGASGAQLFRLVTLPAASPAFVTGLRLAIVFALVNVVAVEFIINYGGVGYLVGEMADRYEVPAMYGAIASIIVASATFYILTERLGRWLRPF